MTRPAPGSRSASASTPASPTSGRWARLLSTTITALGDTVNVAARLASAAGPGELLLSMDAARSAKIEGESGERRDLELKGKSERVEHRCVVLGATTRAVAGS